MSETPRRRPRHALSETGPSEPVSPGPVAAPAAPAASVPHPAPAGDDLVAPEPSGEAPSGEALSGEALFAEGAAGDPAGEPADDTRTRALPVVPRPRGYRPGRGHLSTVATAPEPSRPATAGLRAGVPFAGRPDPARPRGGLGLPDLPPEVRPVLPAVLGAVTALLLALGVVAGVNGAPEPTPVPSVPAPAP